MKIGGFTKSSMIDYPGKICATIFTQGCNFRCVYCHNPELVYPHLYNEPIPCSVIYKFLEKRRGLLDGVVFCGGEPTIQEDLLEKIQEVRSLGFAVKLDTNGSSPDVLAKALPYLDYVAMDFKAPLDHAYSRVCGTKIDIAAIRRSMELLRKSGLPYEFRTTFNHQFMSDGELAEIRHLIIPDEKYTVQQATDDFRGQKLTVK